MDELISFGADLNYRLVLPDADVRALLAEEQLRDENIKLLRRFDQVQAALQFGARHCADASIFTPTVGFRDEDQQSIRGFC